MKLSEVLTSKEISFELRKTLQYHNEEKVSRHLILMNKLFSYYQSLLILKIEQHSYEFFFFKNRINKKIEFSILVIFSSTEWKDCY